MLLTTLATGQTTFGFVEFYSVFTHTVGSRDGAARYDDDDSAFKGESMFT